MVFRADDTKVGHPVAIKRTHGSQIYRRAGNVEVKILSKIIKEDPENQWQVYLKNINCFPSNAK
jgi:hypothetical protein